VVKKIKEKKLKNQQRVSSMLGPNSMLGTRGSGS